MNPTARGLRAAGCCVLAVAGRRDGSSVRSGGSAEADAARVRRVDVEVPRVDAPRLCHEAEEREGGDENEQFHSRHLIWYSGLGQYSIWTNGLCQ